jgi:hypothetical protein
MRFGPGFVLVGVLLWVSGCADASGRFQAFEDRRVQLGGDAGASSTGMGGAGADCQPPAPGVVAGPALLALETSTSPGAAILFFGDLETPELDGKTAVKFSYKALAVADRRTEVGEPLVVGPYPIGEDGRFDAPTEESTLPGSANAILPGWIKSDMTAGIMANEKFVANVMPRIPVRRFGEPTDFGGIAVYIMSKASSYHTADTFVIDGGYTAF